MTSYEKWSLVAMYIGSVATSIAVIYALFGAAINRWFERPKLLFAIKKEYFKEHYKSFSDSKSNLDSVDICGILTNEKHFCAERTKVICNGVYIREADEEKYCLLSKLHQKQFEWLEVPRERIYEEIDILNGIEYYVKVAEISQTGEAGDNITPSNEPIEATIRLAFHNPKNSSTEFLKLKKNQRNILISIKILSSTCKPLQKFVQIDWKGEKVNEYSESSNLRVKVIENEKALMLINEGD